jgi:uncharacterized protein with FMN-binding domain
MRYTIGFFLFIMALSGCAGYKSQNTGSPNAAVAADDLYEGTGQGWRGPVLVRVRFAAGNVEEITIIDHGDDQFVGGAAMEELLEQILAYNTADLDAVSGATESSNGFLEAVEDAMMKAAGTDLFIAP